MAQRVQVILEDDLDGGSADETVTFALDGVAYEIDLKSDNAEKLRDLLAPYVEKGRKQSGRLTAPRRGGSGGGRSGGGRSAAAGQADTAKIRTWAKENGLPVNDRGRVPSNVREAYEKANAS
ncbi:MULTISPECIES: Lsr2 family protein [Kitasatospora]|uniref:histone-like nucleoid-structuring protein Lsr2 n=1 Tax=Kitasatospora TaxID=2063 RepID=UPI000C2C0BD8|nr:MULTISPECIES: Lsr2 family protein [Kitasatospora]RAJ35284.1 Lsr2 protein [Kitasatospora sp. SolWspMP-SS2h]